MTGRIVCFGEFLHVHHPDVVHDVVVPKAPTSAPGFVLQGLHIRRASGLEPPIILSCDNLVANGALLHGAVIDRARTQDKSFAGWIEDNVQFPSRMVDAIAVRLADVGRAC